MVHLHQKDKTARPPTAKDKNKSYRRKLQPPDDRLGPDVRRLKANLPKSQPTQVPAGGRPSRTGRPTTLSSERTTEDTGRPTPPNRMEINGSPKSPYVRHLLHKTDLADVRRHRTSGPPRATGRPVPSGRSVPVCA